MNLERLRKKIKRKKPTFKRQEYSKHKKLKTKWVRPRGKHSKLRKGEKARGKKPSTGYGSPRKVRHTVAGKKIVRINTPSQLKPEMKLCSVLISSSVGKRKKLEIVKKAQEMEIKISNL